MPHTKESDPSGVVEGGSFWNEFVNSRKWPNAAAKLAVLLFSFKRRKLVDRMNPKGYLASAPRRNIYEDWNSSSMYLTFMVVSFWVKT